jgi:tetratricopeptide (TPR) repeat protein
METSAIASDAGQRLMLGGLMRWTPLVALLALAACNSGQAPAHTEFQWQQCQSEEEYVAGQVEACTAVASDTGADNRRRAMAFVRRGMLRARHADYTRAIADFGRALRMDPTYAQAYVERGLVHHERGAIEVAMRDFDTALAIEPTLTSALEWRREALNARFDQYQRQLDQLDEALSRDPINASFLNNRCWLRVTNDGDLNAALADCNAAVRIDPSSANALDSRGLVHLKRGEFAAAAADYDAALVLDPGDAHYLYGRGLARRALGQTAEGDADLAAALHVAPNIEGMYANYGLEL